MTSCESLLDADLGSSSTGQQSSSGEAAGALGGGGGGPVERVAIVGSGNWGSAIARIVGRNVVEQVRVLNEKAACVSACCRPTYLVLHASGREPHCLVQGL